MYLSAGEGGPAQPLRAGRGGGDQGEPLDHKTRAAYLSTCIPELYIFRHVLPN